MSGDAVSTGLESDTERVDDDLDFLAGDTLILDVTSEDPEYSNVSETRIFVENYPGAAEIVGTGLNMYA